MNKRQKIYTYFRGHAVGTAYRVAKFAGCSPAYALMVMKQAANDEKLSCKQVEHRPDVSKWIFTRNANTEDAINIETGVTQHDFPF